MLTTVNPQKSEGIWDNYRVKRHMIHSSYVLFSNLSRFTPDMWTQIDRAVIASNLLITDEMMVRLPPFSPFIGSNCAFARSDKLS
jgi:hypothetical protein